ncbi:MAG: hypothetical protein HYT77_03965 [Deltaproteobacteria bacterium]|nr:hypothetical protein [Deltaproteobacteria bacterium]
MHLDKEARENLISGGVFLLGYAALLVGFRFLSGFSFRQAFIYSTASLILHGIAIYGLTRWLREPPKDPEISVIDLEIVEEPPPVFEKRDPEVEGGSVLSGQESQAHSGDSDEVPVHKKRKRRIISSIGVIGSVGEKAEGQGTGDPGGFPLGIGGSPGNGTTIQGQGGEGGGLSLKDLYPTEETLQEIAEESLREHPPQFSKTRVGPGRYYRAEDLTKDPLFKRHAERELALNGDDPRRERLLEKEGFKVRPDGSVVFWERPIAQKGVDTVLQFVPQLGVLVSPFYKPNPEPTEGEKTKILESTFEERAEMAEAFRKLAREAALKRIDSDLQAIWNNPGKRLDEKKRIFFDLWDETLEAGKDDWAGEEVLQGAMVMREGILSFIRQTIPAGSPRAYTPEELKQLNQIRTSGVVFNPYPN